jgi:hypothetical protein
MNEHAGGAVYMRPSSSWRGEATNPFVAALVGAVVALGIGCIISFLFSLAGFGAIANGNSWKNLQDALWLSLLNYYAAQHITLVGAGAALNGNSTAWITLPITIWSIIPVFSLIIGGLVAGYMRNNATRWSMLGVALGAGVIHVVLLAGGASLVKAGFSSTALPPIEGFELNPPELLFSPSINSTLIYGSVFGIIFSYLGGLMAVRAVGGVEEIPGKWWACAKAVLLTGLVVQILIGAVALAALISKSDASDEDMSFQPKVVQALPAMMGIGYLMVYSAELSAAAVPVNIPAAAYKTSVHVYRGNNITQGSKVKTKPPSKYLWLAALIGSFAILMAGRMAVRMGSRDGSLPTAFRIAILQFLYLAVVSMLCRMSWGIVGQSDISIAPQLDTSMLFAALGVFIFAFIGAHWANRLFAGRLSGFPSV